MIIDRDFIIDNDILTLYKHPLGFPWDIKDQGRSCKRKPFPMEIKMLSPKEGRMLFFLLKMNFESQKFKDLMMGLRKDNCILIISDKKITGKTEKGFPIEKGFPRVYWDEKITNNLYKAMVKYYTEKKITNDDFLEVILINTSEEMFDLIMDYYESNGELKRIWFKTSK